VNTRHCLSCGDPLGIASRADRRTCSDLCRKRVSLARLAGRAASGSQKARQAAIGSAKGQRPTQASSREERGLQL
jgi:hypothetical protein